MAMRTVNTKQFGRVMVLMDIHDVLRLQKQKADRKDDVSKSGWAKVEQVRCIIRQADGLRAVAEGVSIKSEVEKGDNKGEAAKRAFARALRKFTAQSDRVALWKAWGV